MQDDISKAIQIFYCYAPEDSVLLKKFEKHLAPLKRSKKITAWYDREIQPGMSREMEIITYLNITDLILLFISPDFIASEFCYTMGMQKALKRHQEGTAIVIPIILRPVLWKETPIGDLQILPRNGKPITSWKNRDEACLEVATDLWEIIKKLLIKYAFNGENDFYHTGDSNMTAPAINVFRTTALYLSIEKRFIPFSIILGIVFGASTDFVFKSWSELLIGILGGLLIGTLVDYMRMRQAYVKHITDLSKSLSNSMKIEQRRREIKFEWEIVQSKLIREKK